MCSQHIGESIRRIEDSRFLCGQAQYTDDIRGLGQLYAVMVRSDHAAGLLSNLETEAAQNATGVVAVLTGAEYRADGLGPILCTSLPPKLVKDKSNLGSFYPIADEHVNCVGDIVAIVVAERLQDAKNAAELVSWDIQEAAPVVSINDALQGSGQVVPGKSNKAFSAEVGTPVSVQNVFKEANSIVETSITLPRVIACAMEPKASQATYSLRDQRFHLTTSTQSPHRLKQALALLFGRPEADFQVTAPDVGGGFGSKGNIAPEDVLTCWVAGKLRRTVAWCPARSECFTSDFHGRDMKGIARLAVDKNNRIIGAEFEIFYNMGFAVAPSGGVSPILCMRMVQGVYDIPVVVSRVTAVLSNLRPTTSYRGAGRPEATYLIEAAMDNTARVLGLDTLEFRRSHLIAAEQMPYQTALIDCYDSGDYAQSLMIAKQQFDWDGFKTRKLESAARGCLLGQGVANYVEVCGVFSERMEVAFESTGNVRITAGTSCHGQGHETVFAQMISDWLGIPIEDIRLVQGDTDRVHFGRGTWGSRSISVGGSALKKAAESLLARAKCLAAYYLKIPESDIHFDAGIFSASLSNKTLTIQDVARMSYTRPDTPMDIGLGLEGVGYFNASPQNYPSGCHMAEVEIDPRTGISKITRFLCVDDVGTIINPLLLDGQIHGGLAQAVGEVFNEEVIYDTSGQLLSASFMDYGLPKALQMPQITTVFNSVPTETNPLGAKGGAEVGIVGGVSALMLAVRDALADIGINEVPMPATPARIWQLINDAQS